MARKPRDLEVIGLVGFVHFMEFIIADENENFVGRGMVVIVESDEAFVIDELGVDESG
jgi:hypothetical protein